MSDRTAEFFDELGRRGHVPAFDATSATIRLDLEHDHGVDHWYMTISRGVVQVSHENRDADAVFGTAKELFDRIVTGEASAYAAWVRSEYTITGDMRLARLFQRLLPGRPGAHHPREFARARRHQA